MPNTKLKKLYDLYKEENPDILGGMDENSFITKFSNKEKLEKLYDLTDETDKDLLGGMSKSDYLNKFIPNQDNKIQEVLGVNNFQNQSDPRVGVSSPAVLNNKKQNEAPEKISYVDQDNIIKQDQTQVKSQIDEIVKPMQGHVFTEGDDPIAFGAANTPGYEERLKEGIKENPQRTFFNVNSDAIGFSESQVNANIDIVDHSFRRLYFDDYGQNEDKAKHAFSDFMNDYSNLVKITDDSNPNNIVSDDYKAKAQESFKNKWDKALKDENINKYLWPTLNFASKIDGTKSELKANTPNYQIYLNEINQRQQKEDKISYINPVNWQRALSNKLLRPTIGTNLEDLGATLETYLGIGYGLRETGRKLQERNPSATRFQRDMVEDYIPDDNLGVDYAIDEKGNFKYAVDQKTGNKVQLLNVPTDDLKKSFEAKNYKTRRNWGSIFSQGADEAYQELFGIAITVMSDGIGSSLLKGIQASKYAGTASKTLKAIESVTTLKPKSLKKIASGAVEFSSGSIEGTADAREQAMKMGLTGDEAIAWIAANQAATGLFDAINPAEIRWRNTEGGKFFKKLTDKYASGNISKLDLLKESGAQSLIDIAKNQGTEFLGEAAGESIVRNELHDFTDKLTGVNTHDSRENINARSVETAFWGSLLASGTFGAASGIRLSKSNLMRDAIDYAIKNPDAFEGYYSGMQTSKGFGLDRAEFFKSTIEQVNEAGLSDKNKPLAASLIFDRQNASLQIEDLTKKYGADAPIVKRAQKELSEIEIKIDDLFEGRDIKDTEPKAQAASSAGGQFATDKQGASNDDSGAPLSKDEQKSNGNTSTAVDNSSGEPGTTSVTIEKQKEETGKRSFEAKNRTDTAGDGTAGTENGPTILDDKKANLERRRQIGENVLDELNNQVADIHLSAGQAIINGTWDGDARGKGKQTLEVDEDGNIVLRRGARDEQSLTKSDLQFTNREDLYSSSTTNGIGNGVPTSSNSEVGENYQYSSNLMGVFKIPHAAFLKLVKEGKIVLGNIGESEVVIAPEVAQKYLYSIDGNKPATEQVEDKKTDLEKEQKQGSGIGGGEGLKIKYGGSDKDLKGNPKKQWMKPAETSEQHTNRLSEFVEASDFKGREQSAFIDKDGENTEVKLRNDDGKWNWYYPKSKKPFASFNTAKEAIKFIQEQPFWDNGELNKNGRNDAYFAKVKANDIKTELENGNINEDINDGKISANDAKKIIESAGIGVPNDILELANKEIEDKTANLGSGDGTNDFTSPEKQELLQKLEKANKDVEAAKNKLTEKRKKLTTTQMNDKEDLFGERKSFDKSALFDVRAEGDIEKLLEPEKLELKKAISEKEKLTADLKKLDQTPSGSLFESKNGNNKDKTATEKEAVVKKPEPVSSGFSYSPNKRLNKDEKDIEDRFGKFIAENEDKLFNEYIKRFGTVVNTDNVRELSQDYVQDRNRLSNAVHEPASAFAKRIYWRLLDSDTKTVTFTAGGTGAGKSTGNTQEGVVYDGNLNGYDSSVDKIEQALGKDKEVRIRYTYREPVEAFTNGVIPRATRRRDQQGGGRTVPISEHIKTHLGAFKTIQKLYEKYKDNPNVTFHFIDNSYGKGNSKKISFGELQKKSYLSANEYRNKIEEEALRALARGDIRQSELEGFAGSEGIGSYTIQGEKRNNGTNEPGQTKRPEQSRQDNLNWASNDFDPFADNTLNYGGEKEKGHNESEQDSKGIGSLEENSPISEKGDGTKAKRLVKGTPKSRRRIRDPRYKKALTHIVTNAYDYVMQAFISGDKINSEILRKHYKKSGGEIKARIGLLNNSIGFKTIDDFVHSLWENQPAHTNFETSELRDAVESVINEHVGLEKMVEDLNSRYDLDQKELDNEQKKYQEIVDQTGTNPTSEEFDNIGDIYDNVVNIDEVINTSEEELDNKVTSAEDRYVPTQQEIDDGVYDTEGNFILFQKNENSDSDKEEEHKKRCG